MKQVKKNLFYRGYYKNINNILKIQTRKDRKPLGTELDLHKSLNKFFKKKFGWNVRSEGTFVSGKVSEVEQYGKPYIFFPIKQYKYVWSPEINDLTLYLEDVFTKNFDDYGDIQEEETIKYAVNTYIDKNLKKAVNKKNEVTINCKEYYLINMKYEQQIKNIGQ